MNILQKWHWIKWKIKLGNKFAVPFIGTYVGCINVQINNGGILKLASGFSCRDNILFSLSGGDIVIGKDTFLNDGCKLNARKRITIGRGCMIGQNVLMYDHDHNYYSLGTMRDDFIIDEITIGDNVWIGSNVVILRGTSIGNGCVIGAGCIVKGTIESGMLVYSDQTKIVKRIREDVRI